MFTVKAIIISLPKSGTYLCQNLLGTFGLHKTLIHFGGKVHQQYDSEKYSLGRTNPELFNIDQSIEDILKNIPNNSVSVTHQIFDDKHDLLFKPFKKILVHRDLRGRTESFERFEDRWGKWKRRGMRPALVQEAMTKGLYADGIMQWRGKPDVFTLHFDDMVGVNTLVLDQLQQFLFNEIKYDSESCMNKALAEDSLTKSEIRK